MAVAHKSAISVGMIYIPCGLYKTTRDISINFNQLCKDTHQRIKYKKFCGDCGKEVKAPDIIKGYEFEKDKYVTITSDELEKIKTKKDKTIHIIQFSKMNEIENIHYDKNYYIVPDIGGEKAYELFRQSMLKQKKVAIAKTVLGTNETLIVLYPTKEGLIAKTLFYAEEVQEMPKSKGKAQVEKSELDMANSLIESMTKEFDIAAYHDEYQERLQDAIEKKIAGQEIISADSDKPNNVIDLMEALKKTVDMAQNNDLKTGTK